MLHLLLSDSPI